MIADLLNKIIDPNTEGSFSLVGTVIEVNEHDRTCDVEPLNGTAVLYDVKLQANENSDTGFVVFPKKGSTVIVTFLNEKTGFVSLFSDPDKTEIVVGGQRIFFNKNGLKLSKQNADLREQLDKMFDLQSDILQLLTTFQLMTNVGVTTNVMPNIIVELQKLKLKNEGIKTTIGQIIQ
jgi:hypothetical protein